MKTAIFVLCVASVAMVVSGGRRIIGGQNAATGQFPYQISLRVYDEHECGGSILDETTILTAGHCIYMKAHNTMTVYVGNNKLDQQIEKYQVSKLILHEGYIPEPLTNDIAIVKLASPIRFRPGYVEPIRLRQTNVGGNEMVILSGWGYTDFPNKYKPNDLQFVNMKTISVEQCELEMRGDESTVCTVAGTGSGGCQGDSGGPLVDENREQMGIVSRGEPCALGYPDVFTRVYYYLNWIEAKRR